jgi:hypothetical protein
VQTNHIPVPETGDISDFLLYLDETWFTDIGEIFNQ